MDEFEEGRRKQQAYLAEEAARTLAEKAPLIAVFRQGCLDKGVAVAENAISYIPEIGVVAKQDGLITDLHPELSIDKDGLYKFQELTQLYSRQVFAPGYLFGKQFMLMAHPYFRRGFHPLAAFPPRFLELFWKLEAAAIDKFIALDPERVRINVDNSMYVERDTWYGARFNKDIRLIPDEIVKMAPPSDLKRVHISFLFNDVCALDIKWATKGVIKNFYAEEFQTEDKTVSVNGALYHPARYIHAEFDLNKGEFIHFDGALHFYSPEDYQVRVFSDFNYNEKSKRPIKARSQKLFRMDGKISIEIWMEFVSHFFTSDPLVFEYFEGAYPEDITEMIDVIRKNNL